MTAGGGKGGHPGDVPQPGQPGQSGTEIAGSSVHVIDATISDHNRHHAMEGFMNHSSQMQECLDNCRECHSICTETAQHCLQMGGTHAEAAHVRLLLDCAQICQTSADFMLRGSSYHTRTCGICADICSACAESCEQIGADDSMMKTCAEVCRRCAASCRQMAQTKMAA